MKLLVPNIVFNKSVQHIACFSCMSNLFKKRALKAHLIVVACLFSLMAQAAEFDHAHRPFDALLVDIVQVSKNGQQTRVDYSLLHQKRDQLNTYLTTVSAVSELQYKMWHKDEQLSFLINAYNAFTLKLIDDNWQEFEQGKADSIKDLGSFFSSPWRKSFFTLLDKKHSLDDIEHQMIRKWFAQPLIHAALVCAAVSCPPLRNEAYTAKLLNSQLNQQMQLFLADNSRNKISVSGPSSNPKVVASLSSIFKWYGEDFEKGDEGFTSLFDLLLRYKTAIVQGDPNASAQIKAIESKQYQIEFNDYDWRLNDVSNF